jgi:hypothetical protein
LEQKREDSGHAGEPGHFFFDHGFNDLSGIGKGLFKHHGAADLKSHQYLVETVVKRQRKHINDDVMLGIFKIRCYRMRRGDHVTM